jgi:hypothetical protein
VNFQKSLLPLDRFAMTIVSILVVAIGILLWSGDRTVAEVRNFSWQNRQINADDTAFILSFNRQVDRQSVEQALKIVPPLPGKISWAGSKLAYTLLSTAPYDNTYTLDLRGAREVAPTAFFSRQDAKSVKLGKEVLPFVSRFRTPDRMFAYLGTQGEEKGRVIVYNLKTQERQPITPPNLVVTDFKIDRSSSKVVFTATTPEILNSGQPAISNQQIYQANTGIKRSRSGDSIVADQKVQLVVDNQEYQNIKFDFATDGNKVVTQRVSRKNPNDFALWVFYLDGKTPPTKLKNSGDFVITPDSSAVAAAEGEGVSIFRLTEDFQNNLDFLPKYGTVLSFASDGSAAAMIKFNPDATRSLYLVSNQGKEEELLKTGGSVLDAIFSPSKDLIYCLATELQTKNELSQEQPYLVAIDLKTKQVIPLLLLPIQQGINMSLSPDGLAIMFDRVANANNTDRLINGEGEGILWLLPIPPNLRQTNTSVKAEQLPLPGWHPQWLF